MIVGMNRLYGAINNDSSFSSTSWSSSESSPSSSSDSDDIGDFAPPQTKKAKRNPSNESCSNNESYTESEMNYDLILEGTFKWTIKDFTEICEQYRSGEKLESPIFITGTNEELKWRLQLYPHGLEQNKMYLAVYLVLVSSKEPKPRIVYKISLVNNKKRLINTMQNEGDMIPGQRSGFQKFIKSENVLKCVNILESDRLTLQCNITTTLSKLSANKIKVVNDLQMLLDSGNYSDATLNVENRELKVHKYILAARSPVFAAMFRHDMKEKKQNIVDIPDITYAVMKQILSFTYTGEVENLDNSAKDLLAAADQYALEDLKTMCENSLCKNLNVNNAVEILNFAELYSAAKLKKEALSFVVSNINDVIDTAAFVAMEKTQSLLGKLVRMLAAQKRR